MINKEESTEKIVLRTKNLHIGYRSKKDVKYIAKNIELEIGEGELVGVIGVNGVGKSTLLRSISGIQENLGGEIFVDGTKINSLSPEKKSKLISIVLTEQPLSKNLSVFELIALGRQPYTNWLGTLTSTDLNFINEAIDLIGIGDLKSKKCYELSDGQLQRVLIARAISQNTALVVLDEPTTHLDIYHQAYVLKLMKDLTVETNKSIVFATHEINLALQLCDKIILLNKEEVITGSPAYLKEKGVLSNLFPQDLIIFDPGTSTFKLKT